MLHRSILDHDGSEKPWPVMGLDFEKLMYRFNGRDMRLTDVHGHLIPEVLA